MMQLFYVHSTASNAILRLYGILLDIRAVARNSNHPLVPRVILSQSSGISSVLRESLLASLLGSKLRLILTHFSGLEGAMLEYSNGRWVLQVPDVAGVSS